MLTAQQENERTLARLVGISEEEAAQRLAFKVRVRACDSASQDFATHLRALLGFMIAAISMLTFYQAMWEMLHILKIPRLVMPAPFPLNLVPPWGLPRTANLCLWGGIFGAVFGVALPRFTFPLWFCGLGLGALMGLVDMVFFPELTGSPAGYEWSMQNWVKAMLLETLDIRRAA